MIPALPAPPLSLIDGAALFLDFDGTLVEIADAPDAISVAAGLPPLLLRLAERLDGRLAIISGRALDDLATYLDLSRIAASGSHGFEIRLPNAAPQPIAAAPGVASVTAAASQFAGTIDGLIVETKPAGVAIHFRAVPEAEGKVDAFMTALAEASGLHLQRGKMVAELRPADASKATALRQLMAQPPFRGARPLFMGDDWTDEDGFEAATDLGGGGILIGPARATVASWRLADVAAAAAWLEAAAA